MKSELAGVEERILGLLSAATGNILDDEELIDTLAQAKVRRRACMLADMSVYAFWRMYNLSNERTNDGEGLAGPTASPMVPSTSTTMHQRQPRSNLSNATSGQVRRDREACGRSRGYRARD